MNPLSFKKTIALIFLSAPVLLARAQDSLVQRPVWVHARLWYDFPLSYGATAGIDLPFRTVRSSFRQKDLFWGLFLGGYRYPLNSSGWIFSPSLGIRYSSKPHFYTELSGGPGLLRTVYEGRTYEVDANGQVKELPHFGRFYATTHLSYGLNWILSTATAPPWVLTLKPSLWAQFPFEQLAKLHISIEAGISYAFGETRVKSLIKLTKKHETNHQL